ncbi:MAG: zinc-ribbon domain-containing protein [Candidatus Hermodarchaeota archaeon]
MNLIGGALLKKRHCFSCGKPINFIEFLNANNECSYKDLKKIWLSSKNDKHFPFPYIFTPPTPPIDLGLAAEPQAKLPITEEVQEYEPYCKHCGAELPKGQTICHICGKKSI